MSPVFGGNFAGAPEEVRRFRDLGGFFDAVFVPPVLPG